MFFEENILIPLQSKIKEIEAYEKTRIRNNENGSWKHQSGAHAESVNPIIEDARKMEKALAILLDKLKSRMPLNEDEKTVLKDFIDKQVARNGSLFDNLSGKTEEKNEILRRFYSENIVNR